MKTFLVYASSAVAAVALFLAIVFGLDFFGFANYSFFSPKVEKVRYDTFKESQAYNDGMIRDLEEMKMQYISAGPEQKDALRAIILHRFSVYPVEKMPADLRSFYTSIQGVQQ
jgi:hypothetical protein